MNHIKCGTTVAHDNAVLGHIAAKIVFPGGSDRQETTILERNTCFRDRDSGAILLAFKLSIHG